MQHIAPERSAGNRPCRRPPLAESGRIRRRCVVHLLCDVIASRSYKAAVVLLLPSKREGDVISDDADFRAGLFARGTLTGTPRIRP